MVSPTDKEERPMKTIFKLIAAATLAAIPAAAIAQDVEKSIAAR